MRLARIAPRVEEALTDIDKAEPVIDLDRLESDFAKLAANQLDAIPDYLPQFHIAAQTLRAKYQCPGFMLIAPRP